MNPEDISKAQLSDQLRSLKRTCESALRITENKQYIKSNRINSLLKKRHELQSEYRRTIQCLDHEIRTTQSSKDYSNAFSS